MAGPTIRLKNSTIKGTRILLIDPDKARGEKYEALSELDPDFQRVDLFTAASLEEGRDLARKHGCDLAIFPDQLTGSDFVNTQMELRNAQPTIELIPAVDVPTIAQLRSSRKIGGISDFAQSGELSSYEGFKNLVLNALRERKGSELAIKEGFAFAETIQRCLLVDRPVWKQIKQISESATNQLAVRYDLSSSETLTLFIAERIYFPDLAQAQYDDILQADKFGLSAVLKTAGRWVGQLAKPTSTAGFIVTCANFLGELLVAGKDDAEILATFKTRPSHLLHPSLRAVSEDVIALICSESRELRKNG